MNASQVFAALLVALTPIHFWALIIVGRGLRRSPDLHGLLQQRLRFLITAASAVALAVASANFLLGNPLPRGIVFVLMVVALVLISGPPTVFVIDYYRRS